jgi:hypothetical protein
MQSAWVLIIHDKPRDWFLDYPTVIWVTKIEATVLDIRSSSLYIVCMIKKRTDFSCLF